MPTIQGLRIPLESTIPSCDKNEASASHNGSDISDSSGKQDEHSDTHVHQKAMETAVKKFAEKHNVPWEKCDVFCTRVTFLKTLPREESLVFV